MDKTVMNLMNHLISNGYSMVEIVNLLAYRSKEQDGLINRDDEFEKVNVQCVRNALRGSELIIVGWGRDADKKAKYKDTLNIAKQEMLPFRERVKCFQDKKGNVNCHLSVGYSCLWQNENEQFGS